MKRAVLAFTVGAVWCCLAAAGTSATVKPIDHCSNLRGVQKKIPVGYRRGLHNRCIKKTLAVKVVVVRPPTPVADPTVAWAPTVEVFYRDTITSIQAVGTALQDFVKGTSQPNEFQTALLGLSQCEATLARDTGVTPTSAIAQNAIAQMHTVCSLLSRAATEIGSLNIAEIQASANDLGSAVTLLKAVVSSLGQPT